MKSENKNFLLNLGYQGLTLVFPLVTVPYVSRVLGAQGVGVYSFTYNIAYVFVLVGMLGINNYGNRAVARVRDDPDRLSAAFSSVFGLQVLLGVLAVTAYLGYALTLGGEHRTIALLQLVFVVSVLVDVNWFFFGLEKFAATIIRNLIVKVLSLVLLFTCVRREEDLWVYTLVMAGSTLVSQLYLFALLPSHVRLRPPSPRAVVGHLRGAATLFLPVLAFAIYRVIDKAMIGGMSSMAELGNFENAEKIINIPIAVITALGTVMLPRMSYLLSDPGFDHRRTIRESMNLALMLATSMAAGLLVVADDASAVLFGPGFERAPGIIRLLAVGVIASAWANVVRTQFLIPRGHDRVYVASTIGAAVLNLVINLALIPPFGALGACAGTLVAEYFIMVYQSVATRRELETRRYLAMLVRHLLIAAGLAVPAVAARTLVEGDAARLAVSAAVFGAAFLLAYGRYLVKDFLGLRRC